MTWVHLANLKGPKGDVGPVNVGVSGVTAIGNALRFSFTDGRTPQDVNLPLATSTSAGLLSVTGWTDYRQLLTAEAATHVTRFDFAKIGPLVMCHLTAGSLPAGQDIQIIASLPAGFRFRPELGDFAQENRTYRIYTTAGGGGLRLARITATVPTSALFMWPSLT